jgi:hypothetical protein
VLRLLLTKTRSRWDIIGSGWPFVQVKRRPRRGGLVDPKGQDGFVKSRHKRGMNQAIAFLVGRANQIEIPCNEPGTINLWKKLQEVFEEGAGVTVVSWSVHVGDS